MPQMDIIIRKPWADAPGLAHESVRRAFAPGGKYHGVLRLEWDGHEHLWYVQELVKGQQYEKDPKTGIILPQATEQWLTTFDTEPYGGAQPDDRLLEALQRMDKQERGPDAVAREYVDGCARRNAAIEREEREAIEKKDAELDHEGRKAFERGIRDRKYYPISIEE